MVALLPYNSGPTSSSPSTRVAPMASSENAGKCTRSLSSSFCRVDDYLLCFTPSLYHEERNRSWSLPKVTQELDRIGTDQYLAEGLARFHEHLSHHGLKPNLSKSSDSFRRDIIHTGIGIDLVNQELYLDEKKSQRTIKILTYI